MVLFSAVRRFSGEPLAVKVNQVPEFEEELVYIILKATGSRESSSDAIRKFSPLFDRVLVERFAPEVKTKGGIMIPEKAAGKVVEATVVSTGPGARTEEGKTVAMTIKAGDRVLLPEYGGTKVVMDDKEYFLFREQDIMGKWNE